MNHREFNRHGRLTDTNKLRVEIIEKAGSTGLKLKKNTFKVSAR